MKPYADGHEQELWDRFSAEMYSDKLGGWLYNGRPGNTGVPPDLSYYEGYKICQAFYEHASDKAAALKTIMVLDNEEDILKKSSYGSRFAGRDIH